ncbi:MAG: diacylglycerol kinase family protein [Actinomycetota bacterium]|nr:diacylglycerol kinase family protein [Actinomycetota bacterium]
MARGIRVYTTPDVRKEASRLDAVAAALRARDHDPILVDAFTLDDLRRTLAATVADGDERIVVVGGDGLVHHATQAIAGTDTALAVVGSGSGNDFARALGLATDVDGAVEAALAPTVALDALRCEHGWVASVATLGFSATVNHLANKLPPAMGSARYSAATVVELPRLRRATLRCTLDDGEPFDLEATLVAIANTDYFGGGMEIVPGADPADGALDVVTIGAVGRLTLARYLRKIFSGSHIGHPAVATHRVRRIRIEGDDGGAGVWGDGERLGPLPVTFEVVPGALHVAGARLPRNP